MYFDARHRSAGSNNLSWKVGPNYRVKNAVAPDFTN